MSLSKFASVACLALIAGFAGTPARAQQENSVAPVSRVGRYNKSAEVVVDGTIQSIQVQKDAATMPLGTYLILQSGALTWNVHMGALSSGSIPFKAGDAVTVTGSPVSVHGTQIFLARQVQSPNHSLTVRSSNGFVVRGQPAGETQGGLR